MKVMILAGGFGTRISEETAIRPKPMVEIGTMPILWHIMKIYSAHGLNDFVICAGYKGYMITEWFASYALHHADVTFDLRSRQTTIHRNGIEPWRVTVVDTGDRQMTGGRVKRAMPYVDNQTFCMTYGDGVADIDITAAIAFHRQHGKKATMTAVQPEGRFGAFALGADQNLVSSFHEKPKGDGAWINGGFFVLEPSVADYIDGDDTVWEHQPLQVLAEKGELAAYRHGNFWMPMDTLRDKHVLEELWNSGKAPWKCW
jgi:glucose-1-phosphate cytidylyltransferase